MADFQAAQLHADGILTSINELDMADRDNVRQEAANRFHDILASIGQWQGMAPSDGASVHGIRDQIAGTRRSLHDVVVQLELTRTEWADRYRQAIGDGKDAFEKLSEQLQQQQSAEAFRWKRNFAQVTDIMEDINRFNGRLMDLSSQIEHEHEEAKPPAPDIGRADRTDRDPAMPSNLS